MASLADSPDVPKGGIVKCAMPKCEAKIGLFWCGLCKGILCEQHWMFQIAHFSDEHKNISLDNHRLLKQLIPGKRADSEIECEHDRNSRTKWFGVAPDTKSGKPKIYCFDRFRQILRQIDHKGIHYPSLISFQGETAAGKSSVIRSLLKVRKHRSTWYSQLCLS